MTTRVTPMTPSLEASARPSLAIGWPALNLVKKVIPGRGGAALSSTPPAKQPFGRVLETIDGIDRYARGAPVWAYIAGAWLTGAVADTTGNCALVTYTVPGSADTMVETVHVACLQLQDHTAEDSHRDERVLTAALPRQGASSSSRRRGMKTTVAKSEKLTPMGSQLWLGTEIVALDLEGSGAQDHDTEAILEVAVVPLQGGQPDLGQAFTSLVKPGRPIPQRPWISPGLTDAVLAEAPTLEQIAPRLAELVDGRWVLGHNICVDWRLLSGHLPELRPAGLLDTLLLARTMNFPDRSLSALVDRLRLREMVQAAAGDSQPHRAYWDSVATAYLLPELVYRLWPKKPPTFDSLRLAAGVAFPTETADQPALFD